MNPGTDHDFQLFSGANPEIYHDFLKFSGMNPGTDHDFQLFSGANPEIYHDFLKFSGMNLGIYHDFQESLGCLRLQVRRIPVFCFTTSVGLAVWWSCR